MKRSAGPPILKEQCFKRGSSLKTLQPKEDNILGKGTKDLFSDEG